jgi:hypothetical protein
VPRSLLSQRRTRRQTRSGFRLHKPQWIDPFPQIPGTEPEKRFFEALYDARIFFIFQGQIPELEKGGIYVTLAIPGYKPDFVLPEFKVIIDPFSPFHHSLPDAVERDARKVALYTALGYTYYHPWAIEPGVFSFDQDRLRRVMVKKGKGKRRHRVPEIRDVGDLKGITGSAGEMLAAMPELRGKPKAKLSKKHQRLKRYPGYELGRYLGAGATSVAAANRRRRKPPPINLTSGTRRNRKRRSL